MFEEDMTMLVNVTDAIYDTYLVLMNLEMYGNKNSLDYKNNLEILKHNITVFDNILNRISSNYEMGLKAYEYLISLERFKSSALVSRDLKFSFITAFDKKDEMVLAYIKNRLYQKLLYNPDYALAMANIPEEMQDDVIQSEVKRTLGFMTDYQCSIINDIYILFLTILDELKSKTINKIVLDKFARIKYSYGFVLPAVEEYLIDRCFDVDTKPYIFHHTLASLYQLSEKDFLNSKREIILNIVVGNLEFVKSLNDANFVDYQKLTLAIDIEAIVRACMVAADKETRNIILNLLNSLISSLDMQVGFETISSILKRIPSKMNDDLAKVQIVSVGRI